MKTLANAALWAVGLAVWIAFAKEPVGGLFFFGLEEFIGKGLFLLLGYIMLLLGIYLGVLSRALLRMHDQGREHIDIGPFLRASLRRVDLWMATFASPIIYAGLLSSYSIPFWPFAYLALQTGFSSYVVLRTILESPAPAA